VRCVHHMPFGTECCEVGVRFRLWAPAARQVDIHLIHACIDSWAPMHAAGEGWWDLLLPQAVGGDCYRFRIDGGIEVPDPASRYNPNDVHGASRVVNPVEFEWADGNWLGRPWHEMVLYELHVGTFSPEGTFAGAQGRLPELASLGVTAIELMPVADFPGRYNWGYDGVLPFAPDASYGSPDDLKDLVAAAHAFGLMVFLDVVYNHFGPDGNYLHVYAPQFFNPRHQTPWGAAVNFDGEQARTVRDFFIHNALYWIEEFRIDGLRLDAVHAIADDSSPDIVQEIAAAVRGGPGRDRHVHLVLENDHNAAHHLGADAGGYDAQWNDDFHHAIHVLLTGERDGYYADYVERPLWQLGRCLAEGFAFQGDVSAFRNGARRGETSAHLPPTCFVTFLQNHDQVGNRALGERCLELAASQRVRAAVELFLLAPSPPLLFMGEEWGATVRFPFFCDFSGDLGNAVTEGRRREFARFARFSDPIARKQIPDPCDPATFRSARLDWSERERPEHAAWLSLYRNLLAVRRQRLVPLLAIVQGHSGRFRLVGDHALRVEWSLGESALYTLLANLGDEPTILRDAPSSSSAVYASIGCDPMSGSFPPWSVAWFLEPNHG
jgi:maltooligosyltrehalose trehalohydrolase